MKHTKPLYFDKYAKYGAYHWIEMERFSRFYNPALEARYRIAIKRAKCAEYVLDVGCGDGYLMSLVSPFSEVVVGLDYDQQAVKLASEKLHNFSNCSVIRGDCYILPFMDNLFDIVLLTDVIEHVEEPKTCLQEIERVLRPKGILILTTPKKQDNWKWDIRHVKEYTPGELESVLCQYFSIVEMKFFGPIWWSKLYKTKFGWRAIKILARYLWNPFLKEGVQHEKYGQILVVCEKRE